MVDGNENSSDDSVILLLEYALTGMTTFCSYGD